MTRMSTLAFSVCLIFVGIATAAADTTSNPKSLRMRSRPPAAANAGKRVAQPTPDPQPAAEPAPADPAPTPPAEPAAAPADPAAAPAAPAAPAPVEQTPN